MRQRMAKLGQAAIELRSCGPAAESARRSRSWQASRLDLVERAIEMVHRQMILRDDDRRRMRRIFELNPRAAAGMRDRQRLMPASETR